MGQVWVGCWVAWWSALPTCWGWPPCAWGLLATLGRWGCSCWDGGSPETSTWALLLLLQVCSARSVLSLHSMGVLVPVPNLLDVSGCLLISLSWNLSHLATALSIARGCVVLSGVLMLELELWPVCGCLCSAWSRPPLVVSVLLQCCSARPVLSLTCMGVLAPVPSLLDVNDCILIILSWNLTHLATALSLARGCVAISGVLMLELVLEQGLVWGCLCSVWSS